MTLRKPSVPYIPSASVLVKQSNTGEERQLLRPVSRAVTVSPVSPRLVLIHLSSPAVAEWSKNDTSITTACTNFIAYGRQLESRICLHCAMRLALVPDSAYWTLDLLAIIFV